MNKNELAVADPAELDITKRPGTKVARTLADWERVPRVITEEEEQCLDSCHVSPTAPRRPSCAREVPELEAELEAVRHDVRRR